MNITEILPGIHYVGVNDRTTTRFEGLWSLPQGVSYNAYLVADEKVALIDTVEEGFGSRLTENIREAIGDRKIDYLVINHMEPDHSSSVRALRMLYPDIQIVGNAKTLQMLQGFYGIDTGTLEVKEGDSISLGSKTLSFYMAPMVHWPETMVTWCAEAGTLFSGDAFGTFGAIDGGITDSQIDPSRYWDEMRRYYACIVGKYGGPVQKALAKVRGLNPTTICSTHGPVWQREIPQVMDVYDRLSRYEGEPGVVVAYASMYGNTEQMAERIARELADMQPTEFFAELLRKLVPKQLVFPLVHELDIHSKSYVSKLTEEQITRLIRTLKGLTFPIADYAPFEYAVTTAGGVRCDEVNPHTMESLKVRGLYFAGEVLDLDANTGGYNLQIAFSTGRLAGSLKK